MTNQDVMQLTDEFILGTYKRFPVALESGENATLADFDGKTYIDFASGIGVCSLGCGNEAWLAAITTQAKKAPACVKPLLHGACRHRRQDACRAHRHAGCVLLQLRRGGERGARSNSRASTPLTNTARGETIIVTLNHSFHGRTITNPRRDRAGCVSQLLFSVYGRVCPRGAETNLACVKSACSGGTVCAVMMELIQGEGGVLPLGKTFVQEIARFCKARDILLLIDEVQTGVGRTGSLFCFQQYGIEPDAVTFAKGIAAGLPFGGVLAAKSCSGTLSAGTHATTFGGNPICAAGANAVLAELTPDFLNDVTHKGAYIRETVAGWEPPRRHQCARAGANDRRRGELLPQGSRRQARGERAARADGGRGHHPPHAAADDHERRDRRGTCDPESDLKRILNPIRQARQ